MNHLVDRSPEEDGGSSLPADLRDALPHLARAIAWVAELVDQRRDDLASIFRRSAWEQRAANHQPEVQALDALRRPVGGQLLGADPPYLFRVGLEEDAEEPPPELVPHPVLEASGVLYRVDARPRVAGQAPHRFNRPEVPERVGSLDRISEKASAVIDPRQAPPVQHLVAEDLGPEVFDLLVLGEEAVTADVEAIALVLDGPGQAAHLHWVLFQDGDRDVVLEELVRGGQPGGARAH